MTFLLGGLKSQASQATAVSGVQLQSSAYGKVIPLVYGTTLVAPNLIWYGDFVARSQKSSSSGGKGGGSGGGKNGGGSSYTYSTAVAFGLCEGPIQGIGSVYVNNSITTLADLGFSFLSGGFGQTPWGYLSTYHYSQAISYSGVAYVAAGSYQLGSNAQLPNHNFEVRGLFSGAASSEVIGEQHDIPSSGSFTITVGFSANFIADEGVVDADNTAIVYTAVTGSPSEGQYKLIAPGVYLFNAADNGRIVQISYLASIAPDADPSLVMADILINVHHGAGFPASRVGDFTLYQSYCMATGLLISPAYTQQAQTSSMIDDLCTATNSACVWSGGVLNMVPYGDTVVSANGYTYTPPSSPVYYLCDDDFLPNTNNTGSNSTGTNDDPVLLERTRPSDVINSIKVECLDRSNAYNTAIVEASDDSLIQRFGLRQSPSTQLHLFANISSARLSAQLQLQRQQICNHYYFTLDQRYVLLDPMDIVAITDTALGLNEQWVRITEITENDDGTLSVAAEEYLAGIGHAPLYNALQGQGYTVNYNTSADNANPPVLFEPTAQLVNDLEVWLAVSGGPLWGGCDVYISNDGDTYQNIGSVTGSSRMGLLTQPLPSVAVAASGQTIDTINTLAIDVSESNAQLLSASMADTLALATLCYVDGEFLAYQNATLTGTDTYNLTYLVRGAYGSVPSSHPVGSSFARIDNTLLKYPYTPDFIGNTIYIKLVSFNIYGGGQQTLAQVPAYNYTIKGTAYAAPLADVTNLRTVYVAAQAQLMWDEIEDFRPVQYEIRLGTDWLGAQLLGRVAHPPFTVPGNGTYWVSAYSQPVPSLVVYSENPVDIIIAGSQIVSNVIATEDEAATGWTGTTSGSLTITGGQVVVAGGQSGIYTIPSAHIINIGRIASCNVLISWASYGINSTDNILTVSDYLGDSDLLDSAASSYIDIYPEIALSQDGVTWGNWQQYTAGAYSAQAFTARMQVQSNLATIEGVLTGFTFAVDVPDRTDHYSNQAISASGTTIYWQPDGASAPAPFNGGPDGASTAPHVQVTILNASSGDTLILSGLSLSCGTIKVINGGTGVARNVNIMAEGY